ADLSQANLSGAILSQVDLRRVSLCDVDLGQAELSGATVPDQLSSEYSNFQKLTANN
ncbi:MAG: pentapeptide repeat-containing protein, partial [Moorea sp. SIO3I7]|nr:pentapeptide repeat-containing protein [Moorena sp. SIO3I7]